MVELRVHPEVFARVSGNCARDARVLDGEIAGLVSRLDGCARCAGNDDIGRAWSAVFDSAAQQVVTAIADVRDGTASLGYLLGATGVIYHNADARAHRDFQDEWADPVKPARGEFRLVPATAGEGLHPPGWWQWLEDFMVGVQWPAGDDHTLDQTADHWEQMAWSLKLLQECLVNNHGDLGAERIPGMVEIDRVIRAHTTRVGDAERACWDLGKECREYAHQIREIQGAFLGMALVQTLIGLLGSKIAGLALKAIGVDLSKAIASTTAKITGLVVRLGEIITARFAIITTIKTTAQGVSARSLSLIEAMAGKAHNTLKLAGTSKTIEEAAVAEGRAVALRSIEELDKLYKTPPDSTVFWSGRLGSSEGKSVESVAQDIAQGKGKTTIEQWNESQGIELPKYNKNDPVSVKAWEDASAALARNASGEVRVVMGTMPEVGKPNIWRDIEYPALLNNPNVTKIIQVDPITGAEKVIFQR